MIISNLLDSLLRSRASSSTHGTWDSMCCLLLFTVFHFPLKMGRSRASANKAYVAPHGLCFTVVLGYFWPQGFFAVCGARPAPERWKLSGGNSGGGQPNGPRSGVGWDTVAKLLLHCGDRGLFWARLCESWAGAGGLGLSLLQRLESAEAESEAASETTGWVRARRAAGHRGRT